MNKTVFFFALLLNASAWTSLWAEHQHNLLCRHWSQVPADLENKTQRYPTERQVDVLDLELAGPSARPHSLGSQGCDSITL